MNCPYCQQPTHPNKRPDDGLTPGAYMCLQHPITVYLAETTVYGRALSDDIWCAQILLTRNKTIYSLEANSIYPNRIYLYTESDQNHPIITISAKLVPEQAELLLTRMLNL